MYGIEEYGIQSVPPRIDEHNSFYVHTSEGYSRAVEELTAEEKESTEAVRKDEMQRSLESEEVIRREEYIREEERRILEEIALRQERDELHKIDLTEYEEDQLPPPGTNIDLLA